MGWYAAGHDRDLLTHAQRCGAKACRLAPPGPADGYPAAGAVARGRMPSSLPGYIFVGAEYTAAPVPVVSPPCRPTVVGPVWLKGNRRRWTHGTLRLDDGETLGLSRVMFFPGGWHVLDGPLAEFAGDVIRMDRRQRRAYVVTSLGGRPRASASASSRWTVMRSEAEGPAARIGTEDLRCKAERAAGTAHAVRVGHERERAALPARPPVACGKAAAVETEIKIFCKDVFRALQNHTGKP